MQLREATIADMPRIRELHKQMGLAVGLDLEDLEQAKALLGMWVIEQDGVIVEGFYLEKAVELCFFGKNGEATAEARQYWKEKIEPLLSIGVRNVHCNIPPEFEHVARHLKPSKFIRTGFDHYQMKIQERKP